MMQVAMSAPAGSASAERHALDALVGPAGGAPEDHRRRGRQIGAQAFEGPPELPGPRLADRIVERDHEAGLRCRVEPALDQLPGLQIVGQRDRAEIMAERRADARGDRQHRGDAGHDGQLDVAPFRRAGRRSPRRPPPPWRRRRGRRPKPRRRRRPRPARVSAAEARDSSSRLSEAWRIWPSARFEPVEIGLVAEEFARRADGLSRLRRHLVGVAGAKPDHGEPAAHGRCSQPGTSTSAK